MLLSLPCWNVRTFCTFPLHSAGVDQLSRLPFLHAVRDAPQLPTASCCCIQSRLWPFDHFSCLSGACLTLSEHSVPSQAQPPAKRAKANPKAAIQATAVPVSVPLAGAVVLTASLHVPLHAGCCRDFGDAGKRRNSDADSSKCWQTFC